MTEKNKVQLRHEGQPAFSADKENENSSSSPEVKDEKETTTDTTHSPDGDKTNNQDDPDKDLPFHKHHRWEEREKEWKDRFNELETRHQDELQKIREEFGNARKDNAENSEIPDWFGGTQEQWDSYRKWEDEKLAKAEARAIEKLKSEKDTEDKAVKEATQYMESEIATIESDKTLNPDGLKVDPNKLLKIVLDNDLIDSKGKWNYRAGWQILRNSTKAPAPATDTKERKNIAGALNSDSKPEKKPAPYKTNQDFKTNRPW